MKGSSCWGSVILCRVRGIRGGGVWGNNRVASEIETGGPKSGGSNKSFLVRVCFFLAWRESVWLEIRPRVKDRRCESCDLVLFSKATDRGRFGLWRKKKERTLSGL